MSDSEASSNDLQKAKNSLTEMRSAHQNLEKVDIGHIQKILENSEHQLSERITSYEKIDAIIDNIREEILQPVVKKVSDIERTSKLITIASIVIGAAFGWFLLILPHPKEIYNMALASLHHSDVIRPETILNLDVTKRNAEKGQEPQILEYMSKIDTMVSNAEEAAIERNVKQFRDIEGELNKYVKASNERVEQQDLIAELVYLKLIGAKAFGEAESIMKVQDYANKAKVLKGLRYSPAIELHLLYSQLREGKNRQDAHNRLDVIKEEAQGSNLKILNFSLDTKMPVKQLYADEMEYLQLSERKENSEVWISDSNHRRRKNLKDVEIADSLSKKGFKAIPKGIWDFPFSKAAIYYRDAASPMMTKEITASINIPTDLFQYNNSKSKVIRSNFEKNTNLAYWIILK